MWEIVHGGVHYNRFHTPAELFSTNNQKTVRRISFLENSYFNFHNCLLCLSS